MHPQSFSLVWRQNQELADSISTGFDFPEKGINCCKTYQYMYASLLFIEKINSPIVVFFNKRGSINEKQKQNLQSVVIF
jgi:hypothetical protein